MPLGFVKTYNGSQTDHHWVSSNWDPVPLLTVSLQQDITIPRRVQLVNVRCFSLCAGITSVVFEHQPTDPVVVIRFEAFGGCSNLRTVTLPPNLPWIPRYFFLHCTRLTNIPIPNAVRVIAHCAFQQCVALRSIILSENMTGIGYDAYWGCKSLKTVVINRRPYNSEQAYFRIVLY